MFMPLDVCVEGWMCVATVVNSFFLFFLSDTSLPGNRLRQGYDCLQILQQKENKDWIFVILMYCKNKTINKNCILWLICLFAEGSK